MTASFRTEGVFVPDALLAGPDGRAEVITLAAGAGALKRGALLGKIAASAEFTLSLAAAADGSEVPVAVLAEDADATTAAVPVPAYYWGTFNQGAITFGEGHTADDLRDGLRARGIDLKAVIAA